MRKLRIYYVSGVVAVLVTVLVVGLGFGFLTTGRLVVTSGSSSVIAVSKLDESSGRTGTVAGKARHSLSLRLKPGIYVVSVNDETTANASGQTLHVKARQTTEAAIKPNPVKVAEPVLAVAAHSLAAGRSSLLYIESGSRLLYQADSLINLRQLGGSNRFDDMKWAGNSYGVGRVGSGQFYVVDEGNVKPFGVPFPLTDRRPVAYGISADCHMFLTHGSDIYSGSDAGGFTKIYTIKSSVSALAVAADKAAVLEGSSGRDSGTSTAVTVVDKSGRPLAKKPLQVRFGVWSKDGKYLALFGHSSGGRIVNSRLETVVDLPLSDPVSSAGWAVDGRLYYATGGRLWFYDIPSKTAQVAVGMPAGQTISEVAPTNDKSYVYLATKAAGHGGKSGIYRFGLLD